jgi:thymidylate synthase
MVAEATGLPLGRYVHMVSSLHVYDNHYNMLEKIAYHQPKSGEEEKFEQIWMIWKHFTDGQIKSYWEDAWKIHNL